MVEENEKEIEEDLGLDDLEKVDLGEYGYRDPDDAYESYRDAACDALYYAVKELYAKFVLDKHDYYFDAPERFVTHLVKDLEDVSGCVVSANYGSVSARKREVIKVLFVKRFEDKEVIEKKEVKE